MGKNRKECDNGEGEVETVGRCAGVARLQRQASSISQSHHVCLSCTCNSVLFKRRSSAFRPEWGFDHAVLGTLVLRLHKEEHRNKMLRSESCDAVLRCIALKTKFTFSHMHSHNVHTKGRATESAMSTLNEMFRLLMIRLYTQLPGRARNQRGASALEYIVLAAALIIIIGVAINTVGSDAIETAFQNLFDSAGEGGGGAPASP